jgi:hypothetical protein
MRLVRTTMSASPNTRVERCAQQPGYELLCARCNQVVIAAILDRRAGLRRTVPRRSPRTPLLAAVFCLPLRHVRNFLILCLDDVFGQPLHVRIFAIL